MSKKRQIIAIFPILFCFIFSICFIYIYAAPGTGTPTGKVYELDENSGYAYSSLSPKNGNMAYGASSLGFVNIYGNDLEESTFRGTTAYGATSDVNIGYKYDGSYQTGTKSDWNLVSDSEKNVDSYSVGGKIKKGVIIIQKSTDGYTWVDACSPVTNFFADNKAGNLNLYTATVDELKQGMYYRMIVAYEMEKQTQAGSFTDWDGDWERHRYVEVYDFYLCYESNPVTVHDLITRESITSGSSTSNGFYIDKGGSSNRVTVSKDGGTATDVDDQTTFTASGSYIITITTKLGKTYTYSIKINDGLQLKNLTPTVYVSDDKKGYLTDKKVTGNTEYGASCYTTLSLGQSANYDFVTSTQNGMPSYGVAGDSISVFLRLKYEDNLTNNGWVLSDDTWGARDKELVNGIQTGTVGTGALIIQKSNDGVNWVDADAGRYASGLYTTSFRTHYGVGSDVLIYTPLGEDVVNGLYLRVLYAYEAKDGTGRNIKNYVEEYKFYLCSSNLDAITFHNLSITGELETALSTEDQITMELYKRAETMLSGSYTVSGFEIDKTLNTTATITVKRDGSNIGFPSDGKFTTTGKYEISITSAVGNTKTVIIYVDRMTNSDSLTYYFGDSFINGKRIYSEGEFPVFEAGETNYHIKAVDSNHKSISGVINNTTTGTVTNISSSTVAKNVTITEAGHYVVQLSTNSNYDEELKSGDAKIFTFQFDIIEQGTAPGPMVNQRSLNDYAHSTMVDAYPRYYGLTYSSAAAGNITRAYANWDDAFNAAYNYEKGTVEVQENGSYRYIGSFIIAQKDRYESNWDLTEATNYFAEQAIVPMYFDMSDAYTYTTLRDSLIQNTSNLRQLELSRSVVIFADGQKELLTDLDSLPIINDKVAVYLADGVGKSPVNETLSFQFVSDKYDCDSYSVKIIDCNGTEYEIEYNKSVGKQLADANCPSGIITIHEETIYGDSVEYNAVYISEGDNTAEIALKYYLGESEKIVTASQNEAGETIIEADAFTISDIVDELDPYGIIKVSDGSNTYTYCIADGVTDTWALAGDYEITCVNRLGYSYTVKVHLNESDNLVISFVGDGTENIESILTARGKEDIELPVLERYGYNFIGFVDESTGDVYSNNIDRVEQTGLLELTALWEAKTLTMTLEDQNHKVIEKQEVIFGREYDLPFLEDIDDYVFSGWKRGDASISENFIRIDTEEDFILTAVYIDSNGIAVSENEIISNDSSSSIIWIIGIALLVILVSAGAYFVLRKKENNLVNKDGTIENEDSAENNSTTETNQEIKDEENKTED